MKNVELLQVLHHLVDNCKATIERPSVGGIQYVIQQSKIEAYTDIINMLKLEQVDP